MSKSPPIGYRPQDSDDRLPRRLTVLWGVLLLLSVLAGLVASSGEALIVALFAALLIGAGLVARPALLLVCVLFGGLVLSGSVSLYYPPLSQLRWGVVIAAALLGVSAIVFRVLQPHRVEQSLPNNFVWPVFFWSIAFFTVSLFSTAVNLGFSTDAIIGLKGYFQVWGLLLAFAWLNLGSHSPRRITWALLALALVQLPFALHQFFVLVPQRTTLAAARQLIVAPDVVVGTFIGSMEGGGGSAILSALQVICIALLASLWRRNLLSTAKVTLLASAFIIPVLLNETKITLALLPIALTWIYRDKIKTHPIQTTIAGFAVVLVLWGVVLIYTNLPRSQSQGFSSPAEYFEKSLSYNIGDRGYGRFVLNRSSVYSHWLDHHGLQDITHTLIGYGAGETSEGGQGLRKSSIAMTQYRGMGIGLTGLSALLWETGILGTASVIGLFISAFLAACRLELATPDAHTQALLSALQAGMLVMGLSLLHNNYFVFEIGFQSLLFLIIGTIILQARLLPTVRVQ